MTPGYDDGEICVVMSCDFPLRGCVQFNWIHVHFPSFFLWLFGSTFRLYWVSSAAAATAATATATAAAVTTGGDSCLNL